MKMSTIPMYTNNFYTGLMQSKNVKTTYFSLQLSTFPSLITDCVLVNPLLCDNHESCIDKFECSIVVAVYVNECKYFTGSAFNYFSRDLVPTLLLHVYVYTDCTFNMVSRNNIALCIFYIKVDFEIELCYVNYAR